MHEALWADFNWESTINILSHCLNLVKVQRWSLKKTFTTPKK